MESLQGVTHSLRKEYLHSIYYSSMRICSAHILKGLLVGDERAVKRHKGPGYVNNTIT